MDIRNVRVRVREAVLRGAEAEQVREGRDLGLRRCCARARGDAWLSSIRRSGGGRCWVGGRSSALFDTTDVGELGRPGAGGFEVGDCAASGVLARRLLGAEEGFERAVGVGMAFNFCQAGPACAELVVCVSGLRRSSRALEFCE